MNKMNLPAPFGQVTPTPPVVRFVICELALSFSVLFLHLQTFSEFIPFLCLQME